MGKDVIVACDFSNAQQVFDFLDKFEGSVRKPFVKIGMELFYAEGPQIVREIKRRGHKIFLDLKLHWNTCTHIVWKITLNVSITNIPATTSKVNSL